MAYSTRCGAAGLGARPAGRSIHEGRAVHQPQDREGAWHHRPPAAIRPRRRADRMKRRASTCFSRKNEWPREDHTNPFAQPERTGIVRVHQKSQDQPGAKVEPGRRTTAPDRRVHAVHCRRAEMVPVKSTRTRCVPKSHARLATPKTPTTRGSRPRRLEGPRR